MHDNDKLDFVSVEFPKYIVEVFKNVFSDTPEIEIIINDDSSVSVNFSFATLTFYKDLSLGIQTNN